METVGYHALVAVAVVVLLRLEVLRLKVDKKADSMWGQKDDSKRRC